MRILFLTQWFNPEPQFKGLAFAKELQNRGHQVEVLTGFPNYPSGNVYPGYRIRFLQREMMDGVPVIRVPLYPNHDQSALKRILNYLSFAISATVLGPFLVTKADVMYVLSPPATVGLPAIVIGLLRGIPFVYDVQDLWPDTLAATGMVRFPWMLRAVGTWCQVIYKMAARTVVLAPGMKRVLAGRNVPLQHLEVISNWCDEAPLLKGTIAPGEEALLKGHFNLVFAGNMGKVQGLETVLKAAEQVKVRHPEVQFVLVGGGLELDQLKRTTQERELSNVLFLPGRPIDEIGPILRKADALLVHLKDDPLFSITIPSKIQAYLAIGRPILVGVRGDAKAMVEASGAGFGFAPEDVEALVSAITSLVGLDQEGREELGNRGRCYYKKQLSMEIGAEHFLELFRKVATRP